MAISREAYREIEGIVGPENLSEDPAVLDSYACHATFVGIPSQGFTRSVWWRRADAVVLPGSTAEVQEILRICNRHLIKFKAHSTGQAPFAFPWARNSITLDLRRMNRIIEINEEHMYALIEPYVTQAELFVETIKKGLAPHMIDAGASISPLASVTSVHGEGDSSITRSFNERNPMAVEWVLPDGELLRIGSPDTPEAGWFSGDGPGPSLLGMMRGVMGHAGEMGVFTKAAIKLYPWHGPRRIESGGAAPWFDLRLWPLSDLLILRWKDYAGEAEALYLIGEADIFESFGRLSTTKIEAVIAESKSEWAKIRRSNVMGELLPRGGWFGLIVARSQEQMDYCFEALDEILARTGGELLRPEDTPVPTGINEPERFGWRIKNAMLQFTILKNLTLKACEMPMAGTNGPQPAMSSTSIDKTFEIIAMQLPIKSRLAAEGKILDDGPDGCWCTLDEGGHYMKAMNFTRVEPMDPAAIGPKGFLGDAGLALRLGLQSSDVKPNLDYAEVINPYQQKIQDAVDPRQLSSGLFHNIFRLIYGKE